MKKSIIIIGDRRKEKTDQVVTQLMPLLRGRARVQAVDLTGQLALDKARADLIVIFGGDGTILWTARRLGANRISAVGVNLGKLGFLAEFDAGEFKKVLPDILNDRLPVRARMMLDVSVTRNKRKVGLFRAMNDTVVARGTIARMVTLLMSVDGRKVAGFGGDGLILATSSGSTAHALSAGGPIVDPTLDAILAVPLCPHSLSLRPLIIPPSQVVDVEILKKQDEMVLTLDGQAHTYLHESDVISVRSSPHKFHLVGNPRLTFYETIRRKFNWGSFPNYAEDRH
jgi:NAD+ kinase